ncbi:glycosyltransferase [Acidobacteriota bacterium]
MISVIVCSRLGPESDLHEKNVVRTIGCDFEYVRLDNQNGDEGLCAAYNKGIRQAQGDILVFVHEDVFFMTLGWGKILKQKFAGDSRLGLVGVAGTQHLFKAREMWTAAGIPHLRGRVVHELDEGRQFFLTVFSEHKNDDEVVAVDGLFFAIPAHLFDRIQFDENTFDRFHFYDLDICMQIRRTHRIIVTCDILVKHRSTKHNSYSWREAAGKFIDKYRHLLPVSCSDSPPQAPVRGQRCFSVELKGRIPQSPSL